MASDLAREALEPCPFCGGKPRVDLAKKKHCQLHGEPSQRVAIYCYHDCAARPRVEAGDVFNGGMEAAREKAADAWNRRARTDDAIGSGVKVLEWNENGFVSTAIGAYRVVEFPPHPGDVLTVRVTGLLGGESGTWFNNIDQAKAAAQADFERRVLSCLSTHTAAGAVPVAGDFVLVPREPTEAMLIDGVCAYLAHDEADDAKPTAAEIIYRAMLAARPAGAGPVGEAVAWEREAGATTTYTGPNGNGLVVQGYVPVRPAEALAYFRGMLPETTTNAGAGPVGEAVAEAEAERLHEAWGEFETDYDLVREGHPHIHYRQCREAFESAWPDAEKATANAAAILAARPVEEPGDVERDPVAAAMPTRDRMREKILADELAETRERLEKVEAKNAARLERAIRDAAISWCGEKERETFPEDIAYFENNWRSLPGLRQRVELHLGRAVLTGDAQEAKTQQRSYPGNRTREEWEIVAQASAARAAHLPED